jgi:hypothetical protein
VWVRGLVDCPVWMVGRFLCLRTLFFFVRGVHPQFTPGGRKHHGDPLISSRRRR